ncbi:NAD(P)-dependent oxidoreductase, partial [uncultured Mucilaginibacter sp.]|uniref:NAD-dependent epimerase/dehydratase family protein n=1 Tax=uncultured Mucilaginibacter sp. TaxID=797541 RepID=UPI0025E4FD63
NLVLPLKLLNAAIEAGVDLFINTDTVLDKLLNPYALSKGQFSEWGQFFADQKKIHFLNLKLEHFYGPNDDPTKFTAHVINSCLNNTPELNLTLGEQQRDFVFIDDVVSAYVLLLDKHNTFEENFVDIEIGSGIAITIKQFVETAHRLTASTTRLNFGAVPYRTGEAMYSKANTDKLESLGWQCQYDTETGINLIIKE